MAYYEHLNAQPDPVAAKTQTSEEEWPVETILGARMASDKGEIIIGRRKIPGTWDYLVKWAGFDESDNSWVPQENIACPRLINEFWDEFEFPEGFKSIPYTGQVDAAKEWIEFQKKFFENRYEVKIVHPLNAAMDKEDNPQYETGSSTEEEEEMRRKKTKRTTKTKAKSKSKNRKAKELHHTRLVIRLPASKPAESQEDADTLNEFDSVAKSRNVYPSPMSMDD